MKTSKYFYINENRLKLKIFPWLHVDEIKTTLDLFSDLMVCPGHNIKLRQDMSREQA